MRKGDQKMYCEQGHKVERVSESFVMEPFHWWCPKCKTSMSDYQVIERRPGGGA